MKRNKDQRKGQTFSVQIRNGKIFRKVPDIDNAKKILDILKKKNLLGSNIVETYLHSETEKLLEHKMIKPVVHSGEYSVSMAYDVTETSIDMAINLIDEGIFSYDLLPHNFTYHNGEWMLYDFGAFELTPANIKTQIRSTFKISFANFELLRKIRRNKLKHYFLNRIKTRELIKMISWPRFMQYRIKLLLCQFLYKMKFYKLSYITLKQCFNDYRKNHRPEIFQPDNCIFTGLDLNPSANDTILCIGENAAQWALQKCFSSPEASFYVWVDDNDKCDKIYNYARKHKINNIVPAMIYPLVCDEVIPIDIQYRAIYDSFAQERFIADTVIMLNLDELFTQTDLDNLLLNLSYFAKKSLIIGINSQNPNIAAVKEKLSAIFKTVLIKNTDSTTIITANILKKAALPTPHNKYDNNNREPQASLHSQKILEIIKQFSAVSSCSTQAESVSLSKNSSPDCFARQSATQKARFTDASRAFLGQLKTITI